jgi:hypothetical protein
MRVPSALYGQYQEVKTRCRKITTSLVRGVAWNEAVNADETVETGEAQGLLVLHGPSPLLRGEPHFHFYPLLEHVKKALFEGRLPQEAEEKVFAESSQTPWGLLGLLSLPNVMWVYPANHHRPLLEACVKFWDELDALGQRYSVGLNRGQTLWEVNTNLQYVLVNSGVAPETVRETLPGANLISLIQSLL